MLSVILTILKIIGIILLVIIGLLLTVTLTVLFVPIRYQSEGEFKKLEEGFKDNISVRVTWILRILSVSFKLTDTTPELVIKIFGKRLSLGQKKNEDDEKDSKDNKKDKKKKDKKKDNKTKDKNKDKKNKAKTKTEDDISDDKKTEDNKTDDAKSNEESGKIAAQTSLDEKKSLDAESLDTESTTTTEEEPEKKGGIKAKLAGIKQKLIGIWDKIVAICEKIKKVNDIKNAFIEYLRREESKLAIRQIRTILFNMLKKFLPRKLKMKFKFGFDDPSTTGKILGVSSVFYGIYGDNVELEPDFDNVVLEGEYNLNGKIRLIHIVVAALKIYRNKWLKRFIKFSKKTLKS